MLKLIRELRRREVFRTVGLYIGGAWLLLQVVNFFLKIYEQPAWVMKALIPIAIAGLPVVVILAWVFDITPSGIKIDSSASETETTAGKISHARKNDFIVIGLLLLGLTASLFLNFTPRKPIINQVLDPISILISDFTNTTGDSVFEGALEQALTIAIEESPFITAFDRKSASRVLTSIDENANTLDAAAARLVSAREGIRIVIDGNLEQSNGKYQVTVFAVDVGTGEELASFSEKASGKSDVLGVVGNLAKNLRKKLGDTNVDDSDGEETFTTISLEAMHDYVVAQGLARDGNDEEALVLYQAAVTKDPAFGRAWSGLAVSANKLGKTDLADEAWPKALENLDGMTDRERYRTAGVYYNLVTRNSLKAIENYSTLVEKYPADDAGHNNLAVAYFLNLQFDKALEFGSKVVDIYPTRPMYHANYSLYAMYASDFKAALIEADKTLKLKPDYHKAYLPYAVDALVRADTTAAQAAYEKMAATSPHGASLANIGLADMMIWMDDAAGADLLLQEGIKVDEAAGNQRAVATKKMLRAYSLLKQGRDNNEVSQQIAETLALSSGTSKLVPAALMYIDMGMNSEAQKISTVLAEKLNPQQRAYAKLIDALLLMKTDDNVAAIESLQAAINLADLWLVRLYLGQAYANAGHNTAALSEFKACKERLGEAYSLFLDDTPTFRYTKDLDQSITVTKESISETASTKTP